MDVHELTAAYALDALEPHEAAAFEAHLSQCEECREELATLSESAAALAWAVDSPVPPAALRSRILDAAAAERANVIPLPTRSPWPLRAASAAAAVAACTAVGLGLWAVSLSHKPGPNAEAARAVDILADPASRRIAIDGGTGVVAVDSSGQGVLVVRRLPAAPSGKTYEAWVIPPGGTAKPAGLFRGGDGTTIVRLGAPVPRGATVAATVERAGGVSASTETPILSARA